MSDDGAEEVAPAASSDRDASIFGRIFPGPAPLDPRVAARLRAIEHTDERRAEREKQRQLANRRRRDAGTATTPSAPSTAPATADDLAQLVDALHEQTEVIRSLLDADIAIRDDARATAQNTRTFAVAGTIIAFFTMAAAVLTVLVPFLD